MKKDHVGLDIMYYQKDMDDEISKEIKPSSESPWRDTLLKIDNDSPTLGEEKSETVNAPTMKGVFLVKRTRLGLEPGFGFVSSRVRTSMQCDWSKIVKKCLAH